MIAIASLPRYGAPPTLAPVRETRFSTHSFGDGWGTRIVPSLSTPRSHLAEKGPKAAPFLGRGRDVRATDGTRSCILRSHNPTDRLPDVAKGCINRLSKRISLLRVAHRCCVLRSRWCPKWCQATGFSTLLRTDGREVSTDKPRGNPL